MSRYNTIDVPSSRTYFRPALLVYAALACFALSSSANAVQRWARTYGEGDDDVAYDVKPIVGGGYIVAGSWRYPGLNDRLCLVRLDSIGDTIWTRHYCPPDAEASRAYAVVQTTDLGFAAAGFASFDTTHGYTCTYVVRTDSLGDSLWTRVIGERKGCPNDIEQTCDGGFVLAGFSSVGPGWEQDMYVLRLDSLGHMLWSRSIGDSSSYDPGYAVKPTPDGGFIVVGDSNGVFSQDAWLVKLDSAGNTMWSSQIERPATLYGVLVNPDRGFTVAGITGGHGAGAGDYYLARTDSGGHLRWFRTYGGQGNDACLALSAATSGGYLLTGQTFSFGAGAADMWVVRTDSMGDMIWNRTYGGSHWDMGFAIESTPDGGFISVGYMNIVERANDMYVIKADENGVSAVSQAPSADADSPHPGISLESPTLSVPHSRLRYFLPRAGAARLALYDAGGRRRAVLASQVVAPGWHEVTLPADLRAGAYFVQLSFGTEQVTQRTTVVR